jgi:hypothetical protein
MCLEPSYVNNSVDMISKINNSGKKSLGSKYLGSKAAISVVKHMSKKSHRLGEFL